MYTLDTNTVVYYLNRDEGDIRFLESLIKERIPLYLSTIVEIELFSFPDLSDSETETIESLLDSATIISVDSQIARIAGSIRRSYKLNLADSAIAATALFTNTTLVTRNINDFKKIPNLRLQKI